MVVEKFLKYFGTRRTRRYLTFDKYDSDSLAAARQDKSYLLYIHIPFCQELCPYCSFVKVKFDRCLALKYFEALKKEIGLYHRQGFRFDSIYVGGGTPTVMPEKLAEIVDYAKSLWEIKHLSVETNPNHLTDDILGILKTAGTNRLSVGVQSFNNEILKSTDRLKKYGSGEDVAERLSSIGGMFDTLNADMIFNFADQSNDMLMQDIETLKKVCVDQVTWYPLMVSKGQKKELFEKCGKVDYRREKELYKLIVGNLGQVYKQQSVWCFAREKGAIDEYIIDHDEYAAVGASSWGYINGTMYSNTFSIPKYIELLEKGKHPVVAYRRFSKIERMRYDLLIGMLEDNVSAEVFRKKYGPRFWIGLGAELGFLIAVGAMRYDGGKFVLTERGRYYCLMLMRNLFEITGDHRAERIFSDAI